MSTATEHNLAVARLAAQLDILASEQLESALEQCGEDASKRLEDVLLAAQLIDQSTHRLLSKGADPSVDPLDTIPGGPAALRVAAGMHSAHSVVAPLRYQVTRPHAKGGLGEVSIATDHELNRQVALKEIQPQFADDPGARQRFLLEAEVTGALEHPGIVPVYGLGAHPNGRPYYAMRFIRGESLRTAVERFHQRWPSGAALSGPTLELRKLLARFVDVCQTIEYAHSRGVLHRDIKPDNIMLGPYGETLVVDWGLAKAGGREVAPQSIAGGKEPQLRPSSGSGSAPTAMGSVIGTPAFMSPEQAAGKTDQIGPLSDVYSLGATLYFILCGTSPLQALRGNDGPGPDVDSLLRQIVQGQFPPAHQVRPQLPRALSAICARAMELQRSARYSSPLALAEDVERFLADEPVEAYAEPMLLRTKRWIRRHQTLTTTSVALVLATTIGLLLFSSMLSAKQRELEVTNSDLIASEQRARTLATTAEERRKEAEAQRLAAEQAKGNELAFSDFMVKQILAAARPQDQAGGLGINVSVIDALSAAEKQIDASFANRPLAEATTRAGIGDTWQTLGRYERAIPHHREASEILRAQLGKEHPDYARLLSALALDLKLAGRLDEAIELQEQVYQQLKSLLGEEHLDTLTAINNLALSYADATRYDEATPMLREALTLTRRKLGDDAPETLNAIDNLAGVLRYSGAEGKQQATELYEQLVPKKREVLGEIHPATLSAINNLATLYQENGDVEQALAMLEDLVQRMTTQLGEHHPATLRTRANLGFAYAESQQYARSIEILSDVTLASRQHLAPQHPDTLNAMDLLADAYSWNGQLALAIETYQETIAGKEEVYGEQHAETLKTKNNLAMTYQASGDPSAAIPLLESVLASRRELYPANDPRLLQSLNNLAAALVAADRAEQAVPLYEELVQQLEPNGDARERWRILHNLSSAALRAGDPAKGMRLIESLRDEMQAALAPGDWQLTMIQQGLAVAKMDLGDFAGASQQFQQLVDAQRELVERTQDEEQRSVLRGLLVHLATCLNATEQFEAAETAASESVRIAQEMMPEDWRLSNAQSVLGASLHGQGKFEEAEQLLTTAHQDLMDRLEQMPPSLREQYVGKSFERLVRFYETQAKPDQVQKWRTEQERFLEELTP